MPHRTDIPKIPCKNHNAIIGQMSDYNKIGLFKIEQTNRNCIALLRAIILFSANILWYLYPIYYQTI